MPRSRRNDIEAVSYKLDNAMTVRDLIAELRQMDPDARVVFADDYGDITHTRQALMVANCDEFDPETQALRASAYSESGIAIEDREDEDGDEDFDDSGDPGFPVVILS